MRPMRGATKEIEVKLSFGSVAEARERIDRLGARQSRPRRFEDNVLFDRPVAPLHRSGRLLRLRRTDDGALLTYKAPVEADVTDELYKIRDEHETEIGDPLETVALLDGIGFVPVYRYQKYRTVFELDGLEICLDETPVGCFVELEGPPERIDHAAEQLGFTPRQYLRETYRDLHERAIERGQAPPGDMLISAPGTDGR